MFVVVVAVVLVLRGGKIVFVVCCCCCGFQGRQDWHNFCLFGNLLACLLVYRKLSAEVVTNMP